MREIVKAKHVLLEFNGRDVLNISELSVTENERIGLIGANGSVIPQIMIAVNFVNNSIFFFALDYLFYCLVDTVAAAVSFRRFSDIIEPYFYMLRFG